VNSTKYQRSRNNGYDTWRLFASVRLLTQASTQRTQHTKQLTKRRKPKRKDLRSGLFLRLSFVAFDALDGSYAQVCSFSLQEI